MRNQTKRRVKRRPAFRWRNDTIYDGETPIARFRQGGAHDLALREVVLRPGGKPLIWWLPVWWSQHANIAADVVSDLTVDDRDPENLRIKLVSSTADKDYTSRVNLTLSYDEAINSYSYDAQTTLSVNRFPFRDWEEYGKACKNYVLTIPLEYANIWPHKHDERQNWIYKNVDDNWVRLPFNYLYPAGLYGIQFNRREGILAMVRSPEGNPTIRLMDNTPERSVAALCFSAHDMHLRAHPVMAGRKYWARYRIFCLDDRGIKPIVKQSRPVSYTPEEIAEYERPRFDFGSTCDFRKGISFDAPDSGSPWIPFGDVSATQWLKEGGCEGEGCILNKGIEPVLVNWQLFGPFAPSVSRGKAMVFSAWVKTENLEGEGAYIFYQDGSAGEFDAPQCASRKLIGSHDWTKLEVAVLPSPNPDERVHLVLQHKGRGKSWFSRVEFNEAGNTGI